MYDKTNNNGSHLASLFFRRELWSREPKGRASHAVPCLVTTLFTLIGIIQLTSPISLPHLSSSLSFVIMSSSSSQTASASRSPSPITPSTPDSSDNIQVAPFRSTIDLSTWYKTLPAEPISPSTVYWDESSPRFSNMAKEEGVNILSLDDLIQDYAYDEYVSLQFQLLHTRGLNICALVPHRQVYQRLAFLPPFLRFSTPPHRFHPPSHTFSPEWIVFLLPSQWFPPGYPYPQPSLYLLQPHSHEKRILLLLRP